MDIALDVAVDVFERLRQQTRAAGGDDAQAGEIVGFDRAQLLLQDGVEEFR
ncbi:hypothetical protein D3C83_287970 [compost metagenome]